MTTIKIILWALALNIASNLLSPHVPKVFQKWRIWQKKTLQDIVEGRYREALYYHNNPHVFTQYLLHLLARSLHLAVTGSLLVTAILMMRIIMPSEKGRLYCLVGAVFVGYWFVDSIRMGLEGSGDRWWRVHNFVKYRRDLPPETVARVEAEQGTSGMSSN